MGRARSGRKYGFRIGTLLLRITLTMGGIILLCCFLGACCVPDPGTFVLEGFGFQWLLTPHRVNKIGVSLSNSGYLYTEPEIRFQGGTFSTGEEGIDLPTVTVGYGAFSSGRIFSLEGKSPLLTGWGSCERPHAGEPATSELRISVDLPGYLPDRHTGIVLLNGFSIDTGITHPEGYTFKGLAVAIQDAVWEKGRVIFTARMEIDSAPVIDRQQHLELYGFQGDLTYLILWAEQANRASGQIAYRVANPDSVSVYPVIPHSDPEEQLLEIYGDPSVSFGLCGLTGFRFILNKDIQDFPGRYLRELSIATRDISYDPEEGMARLRSDGYFSNSGLITWKMFADFTADYGFFQVEDPMALYGHGEKSVSQLKVEPDMWICHSFARSKGPSVADSP